MPDETQLTDVWEELIAKYPAPRIPPQFALHPEVCDRPFYIVPTSLLDRIKQSNKNLLDGEAWKLEYAMANACPAPFTGFWGARPISSFLLTESTDRESWIELYLNRHESGEAAPTDIPRNIGVSDKRLPDRLERQVLASRAYCGWLLTNRVFVEEHAKLFTQHADQIASGGFDGIIFVTREQRCFVEHEAGDLKPTKKEDASATEFLQDYRRFLVRWQLSRLCAPFLPQPLAASTSPNEMSQVDQQRPGIAGYTLPVASVLPPAEDLRKEIAPLLLGQRCDNELEHLTEWLEITSPTTNQKNKLKKYSRWFQLQHYWAALHSRHSSALSRARTGLSADFATHLGASEGSVSEDIRDIDARLGDDWQLRLARTNP